jgi:hypothetical protein
MRQSRCQATLHHLMPVVVPSLTVERNTPCNGLVEGGSDLTGSLLTF